MTRSARRRALAVVVGVVVVVVGIVLITGCSSGKPAANDGPLDTGFLSSTDALCEHVLEQVSPTPFPLKSFDPSNPEVSQLPIAGAYYDKEEFNHRELQFIRSFPQPKRGKELWKKLVDLVGQQQAEVAVQISTAKAADKGGFVAAVMKVSAISKQIDTVAKQGGYAPDSYFIQLFG